MNNTNNNRVLNYISSYITPYLISVLYKLDNIAEGYDIHDPHDTQCVI